MNYDSKETPGPCSDCVLVQLVPPELRSERIPCRHIPLNASGETLDSLYRSADQHEVEETVAGWLRAAIQRLEEQRMAAQRTHNKQPSRSGETLRGTPLYRTQHPKCANPACPTAFHWTGGGKFFRFQAEQNSTRTDHPTAHSPTNLQWVRHYWLCERCSHLFTLVYEEGYGVVLKLLRSELPATEVHSEVSAA